MHIFVTCILAYSGVFDICLYVYFYDTYVLICVHLMVLSTHLMRKADTSLRNNYYNTQFMRYYHEKI